MTSHSFRAKPCSWVISGMVVKVQLRASNRELQILRHLVSLPLRGV